MTTRMDERITRAGEYDVSRLATVLTKAFATNPVSDWLFLGEQDRWHPGFFAAHLNVAARRGRIDQTDDGTGVAVWLDRTTAWSEPATETFDLNVAKAVERHTLRLDRLKTAMNENAPTEPHWSLAFLGVLPAAQGKGQGAHLLRHAATWLGATPAHLEATSYRLVAYYVNHGWRSLGPIDVPDGPQLYRCRFDPNHPGLSDDELAERMRVPTAI